MTDCPEQPPETLDDVRLMLMVKAGDNSAFARLIEKHRRPLVNFFLRMGVTTDAEDMAQETFVRLYKARARYAPTAKFTTFLYTVARNIRLDSVRRGVRKEAFLDEEREKAQEFDDGGIAKTLAEMDIKAALARLPEKLRGVVILAVYQGLRYGQIAQVLRIPLGTVKSRMFVAMERLKGFLDEDNRL